MRKDVRELTRWLEAVGLTVESTPGHYGVLRDGKPLRKANGMPFTLTFSPDTIRWRRAAIVERAGSASISSTRARSTLGPSENDASAPGVESTQRSRTPSSTTASSPSAGHSARAGKVAYGPPDRVE
jgi:hypothetical protein